MACRVGVSSEPECATRELAACDEFMILASDGIWEFLQNQEAVDLVASGETLEDGAQKVPCAALIVLALIYIPGLISSR